MKKIKIFPKNSFIRDINFFNEKQYNLFVDYIPSEVNKNEINILFLCEPDTISNIIKKIPCSNHLFDFILTHNEEVLKKYKNSRLFVFNSVWATHKSYEPKEFGISTIVGNKTFTKNQIMRQELWLKQDKIPNKKFYASSFGAPENIMGNDVIFDKKDELFKYQFHIAIENCSIDNYFTEKILDCFITKTVPIYCGCNNIEKFFNDKGIIKFKNIKECIEKCKNINSNTYSEMFFYVEENYKKSIEYIDYKKRIVGVLTLLSGENNLL